MPKRKDLVFYKEWFPLPKGEFRILAMLADKGQFSGNLSDLCRYFFVNPQTATRNRLANQINSLEEQGYNPLAFRFMCLNSHYRKQLLFTKDNLLQAENTYNKLLKRIANISKEGSIDDDLFIKYNDIFKRCLENDLNTANALSVLYELLKDNEVNGNTKIKIINEYDKVLSLDLCNRETDNNELDSDTMELIEKRTQAKRDKNFAEADKIRDDLLSRGIRLIDTREGTSYEIIKD